MEAESLVVILAKEFPMFAFAQAADEWLASINPLAKRKKSLQQQLKERRVSRFETLKMISTAGLGYTENGDFRIIFNQGHGRVRDFHEDAFTIGHELGHTFHFDLTQTPPVKTINEQSPEFFYAYDEDGPNGFLIEDFCDAFARQWLLRNGPQLIARACENQFSTIRGYNVVINPADFAGTD